MTQVYNGHISSHSHWSQGLHLKLDPRRALANCWTRIVREMVKMVPVGKMMTLVGIRGRRKGPHPTVLPQVVLHKRTVHQLIVSHIETPPY